MLTIYNNAKDFKDSNTSVAVFPIGSTEQHGSHLPIGTDSIIAGEFGRMLAEKLDAYLLPTLPIANSIEHRKCRGTVFVQAQTLMNIVKDIVRSLTDSGFRRVIIVNAHGGNWSLKPAIRELNRELKDTRVILIYTSGIAEKRSHEVVKNIHNDLHAGEKETSIMKYLCKEYVGDIAAYRERKFVPQDFMDYFDVTDITGDGCWGFPEDATPEKGERLLELYVECALKYLDTIDKLAEEIQNP